MLSAVIRWYRPKDRLTLDELIEVYTDLTFGMLRAGAHAQHSHRKTDGYVSSGNSTSVTSPTS